MPKAGSYDFPLYDLNLVLEKLKMTHDTIRTDEMERAVVAETLGMSSRGGGFANFVSSLEKYELIDTGRGKITITELGKEAIYGSELEQAQAKSKAVSNINLFREIYSQYGTNASEEQFRAFLRQKANVDITKVQKIAEAAYKIYKKVANYITPATSSEQVSIEPADTGRSEPVVAPTEVKSQFLKIQFGDVYIQIPPDDLKAISMAKDALEFMENRIKNEKKE